MSVTPPQHSPPADWRPPFRPPSQASFFLAAGVACIGYRVLGPIFGGHPDNGFIGFGLAFFGLWQGAERRQDSSRPEPPPESCEPPHRHAQRHVRRRRSERVRDRRAARQAAQ